MFTTKKNDSDKHYCGYVNIIGCPNVGKSTLINALIGFKLNIVTPKAQTTRQRILAIYNEPQYQIVFSDTPGIVQNPSYELHRRMLQYIEESFTDADIMILLIDCANTCTIPSEYITRLKSSPYPVIVALNKIDRVNEKKLHILETEWQTNLPNAKLIKVSALNKIGLDLLMNEIKSHIPESPPYFDKDNITDKNERFIVSEVIREKILLFYKEEIPYSCEVIVNAFKESEELLKIQADILVERDSQKGILIGNKGLALTKLGTEARKDLEQFFNKKIFLQLFVKVEKNWRNNPGKLNHFGYRQSE